jgi:predicted HicB family RNase H-like nuclease
MTFDAHAYAIQTRRIIEDGELIFKATVAELPHLATYESSAQEAYDVLIEDIEALHESATELGRPFPEPLNDAVSGHSGRITLRLSRSLHRNLDAQAQSDGVSLNSHVLAILSAGSVAKDIVKQSSEAIRADVRSAKKDANLTQDIAATTTNTGYSRITKLEKVEDPQWNTVH